MFHHHIRQGLRSSFQSATPPQFTNTLNAPSNIYKLRHFSTFKTGDAVRVTPNSIASHTAHASPTKYNFSVSQSRFYSGALRKERCAPLFVNQPRNGGVGIGSSAGFTWRFYSSQTPNSNINSTASGEIPQSTTTTPLNTATSEQQVDLDSLLKQDDLKSIYEELEFEDDTFSIFSYLDPTSYIASFCEMLHMTAGMPWWIAIALTGVLFRLAASPITLANLKFQSKVSHHQTQLQAFQRKLQENYKDKTKRQKISEQTRRYRKEHNIPGWKQTLYPLAQVPFFMAMFFTARHLLDLDMYPDLVEGGAWFFKNLAEPTSFFGLPLMTGIVQAASLELQQKFGQARQTLEQQHEMVQLAIKWGMRVVFLLIAWWMSRFEAVYFCIWLPSALFQLVLTLIQISPQGRKFFKIPEPFQPKKKLFKKKTKIDNFFDKFTITKKMNESSAKEAPKMLSQKAMRSKGKK